MIPPEIERFYAQKQRVSNKLFFQPFPAVAFGKAFTQLRLWQLVGKKNIIAQLYYLLNDESNKY